MRTLTTAMVLASLAYLGVEVPEGTPEQAKALLDDTLAQYDLNLEQFTTPGTMFAAGYHRGLGGRTYDEKEQVPAGVDGKPDADLRKAFEQGFGFGMEARDLTTPPAPSLLLAAWEAGAVKWGGLSAWIASVDLAQGKRLSHAISVGSGKNSVQIAAGTPVDVLGEITKDGVPTLIVGYDGLALLVPNAASDPGVVAGHEAVSRAPKARKGPTGLKKDGTPKPPKAPAAPKGPSLRDVIVHVLETENGPLASNAAIAQRVKARADELGIGDKAQTFFAHADQHVPYYANCYRPLDGQYTGRSDVKNPLAWVVAAIEARKFYLKAIGSHEDRMKAIPPELLKRMEDRETRLTTIPKPAKDAAVTAPAPDATAASTEPAASAAEPAASAAEPEKPAKGKAKGKAAAAAEAK